MRLAPASDVGPRSISFESYTRSASQTPKPSSFRSSRPMVLRRSTSLPGAPKPTLTGGSFQMPGPVAMPTSVTIESASRSGSLRVTPYGGGSVQLAPPRQASPVPPMHAVTSYVAQPSTPTPSVTSYVAQPSTPAPQASPLPMQALTPCVAQPSTTTPSVTSYTPAPQAVTCVTSPSSLPLATPTASARFSVPTAPCAFTAPASSTGQTIAPMVPVPPSFGASSSLQLPPALQQPLGSHLVSRGSLGGQSAPGSFTPQVGPRPSARFERAVAEAAALVAAGPPSETPRVLQRQQLTPQQWGQPGSQQPVASQYGIAQQHLMAAPRGPPAAPWQRTSMPSQQQGMTPSVQQPLAAPQEGLQQAAPQQPMAPQFGVTSQPVFAAPTSNAPVAQSSQSGMSSDIAAWTWGASPDDDDETQGASVTSTSFPQSVSFLSKSDFDGTFHLAPKLVHL